MLCWGVTGRVTTYGGGLQTSSISTTSEPYPRNDSTSAENIRNVRSDSLSEAFIKRSLDWEIKARKLAVERVRLARQPVRSLHKAEFGLGDKSAEVGR